MYQLAPQQLLAAERSPLPGQDGLGTPIYPPVDLLQPSVLLIIVHLLIDRGKQFFDQHQGCAQIPLINFITWGGWKSEYINLDPPEEADGSTICKPLYPPC